MMKRAQVLAYVAAAAFALAPTALAKSKTAMPPPDASATPATPMDSQAPAASPDAAGPATPLTALKPSDVPPSSPVVGADQTPLGTVTKIYVNGTGNVSSILVAQQGATSGKKVPAAQVTLSGGKLVVALNKTAFDALPQAS
jgi:hypothetical protein